MRRVWIALTFCLIATGTFAETFQGRSVTITDGRTEAGAAPLIVAMHGFLGTDRSMRRKTRFDALARQHGLIVAYPNGIKRRWNDGRNARDKTDDVSFLANLIAALVAEGRADPARVFLAGHSNGGGMAMRMACDRPDLIAGISVAATKSPIAYQCRNGAPVPAIFFHGTADPVAPHDGRPEGHRLGGTLSADDTLALWSRRNKCRKSGRTRTIDRRDDGTRARIIQYTGCRAPLVQVLIEGHGHAWPGAGPRLERLQGPATQEVDATALSWWLFSTIKKAR